MIHVAILHNIRSLHNVGSIFRTADGAGFSKLYLTGFTPIPTDRQGNVRPQIHKVALGAETVVPWEHTRSIATVIRKLKKQKYRIIALEQSKKSVPYDSLSPRTYHLLPCALIVGNEVTGIPSATLKLAHQVIEIPMRGAVVRQAHHPRHTGRGKESLNVSVAFGIAAFALTKR